MFDEPSLPAAPAPPPPPAPVGFESPPSLPCDGAGFVVPVTLFPNPAPCPSALPLPDPPG